MQNSIKKCPRNRLRSSITDTSGIDLGNINPFRFKSYYYDTETGFYYLNSRYYDALVGRFINADDIAYLGATGSAWSYNLFAYCENNPVNNVDPDGNVYVSLKTIGRILLAFMSNPIASTLIILGYLKLKKILIGLYTKFLAKWVALIPSFIVKAIVGIIGAVVGVPFMYDLAGAIWDCLMLGKDGVEIYIKKSRWGIPYGIGVEAI